MRDRKSDKHMKVIPAGPGQVRDHLDEDKSNNSPLNLKAVDRGEHTAKHNRTRELGKLRKALTMVNRKERLY